MAGYDVDETEPDRRAMLGSKDSRRDLMSSLKGTGSCRKLLSDDYEEEEDRGNRRDLYTSKESRRDLYSSLQSTGSVRNLLNGKSLDDLISDYNAYGESEKENDDVRSTGSSLRGNAKAGKNPRRRLSRTLRI